MIRLPPARLHRAREFLRNHRLASPEELVHRTLAQSLKVGFARLLVARCIGAIGYLLTGEPKAFDDLDVPEARKLAVQLFRREGLLYKHAVRVLGAKPKMVRRGYIDWERHHLVLLGGRELFVGIVRAMTSPVVMPGKTKGVLTWEQASFLDLSMWVRADVAAKAIEGREHWQEWERAADRPERERTVVAKRLGVK